jgi:hypothetical protein
MNLASRVVEKITRELEYFRDKTNVLIFSINSSDETSNMRNLKNIRYRTWKSPAEYEERQITATAWDTSKSDSFICAYGPSESDNLIELVRVTKASKSE